MYNRRKQNKSNSSSSDSDDLLSSNKSAAGVQQKIPQDNASYSVLLILLILVAVIVVVSGRATAGPQQPSSTLNKDMISPLLNLEPNGQHLDMEIYLDDLLKSIGIGSNRIVGAGHVRPRRLVDLGAAVRDNDPCFSLIDKGRWSALLVDGDDTQPAKWKDRFATAKGDYKGVVSYILAESIVPLLTSHGFDRDIDLLKIDIDSFDCYVMQAILNAGIRPKAIVMEVNVKFPPHVRFAMQPGFVTRAEGGGGSGTSSGVDESSSLEQILFDSEKRGHIYGCSLGYQVNDVMHPNDYELYYMDWNNVMYVDTRSMPPASKKTNKEMLVNNESGSHVKEWYDYGYWNRSDRNKVFGFNKPIVHWYEMDADGLLKEIQNKIMPLPSHAHHHIAWNGDAYCFDQDGYLLSATEDASKCSLKGN